MPSDARWTGRLGLRLSFIRLLTPREKCASAREGGVMFWVAIFDDKLIGPFRVEGGVKINAATYCGFLHKQFRPW